MGFVGTKEYPLKGGRTHSSGRRVLTLSIANLESPPTKEACVDGPRARPDQCQGGAQGSQHDPTPRMSIAPRARVAPEQSRASEIGRLPAAARPAAPRPLERPSPFRTTSA